LTRWAPKPHPKKHAFKRIEALKPGKKIGVVKTPGEIGTREKWKKHPWKKSAPTLSWEYALFGTSPLVKHY